MIDRNRANNKLDGLATHLLTIYCQHFWSYTFVEIELQFRR